MCNAKFEEIQEILQIVFYFSNQKSKLKKKQIIFWMQPLEMKKNMVSGCFGSFGGDFPPTSFLPFTQEYKRDEG